MRGKRAAEVLPRKPGSRPCNHAFTIRFPATWLECGRCGMWGEALLMDLGVLEALGMSPITPRELADVAEACGPDVFYAISLDLPRDVADARAARFLELARADRRHLERVSYGAQVWAALVFEVEERGPGFDKKLGRLAAKVEKLSRELEGLGPSLDLAVSLESAGADVFRDLGGDTLEEGSRPERALLQGVALLLREKQETARLLRVAAPKGADLRPRDATWYLRRRFAAYDHLSGADCGRGLVVLHGIVLRTVLNESSGPREIRRDRETFRRELSDWDQEAQVGAARDRVRAVLSAAAAVSKVTGAP